MWKLDGWNRIDAAWERESLYNGALCKSGGAVTLSGLPIDYKKGLYTFYNLICWRRSSPKIEISPHFASNHFVEVGSGDIF